MLKNKSDRSLGLEGRSANGDFPHYRSPPPKQTLTMAGKRGAEFTIGDGNDPKKGHFSEVNLLRQEVDELREEVAIVSKKIGEMCLSHGSTLTSLQFHGDYLETLSKKVADLNIEGVSRDGRMDKIEQTAQQHGNKVVQINKDILGISRDLKSKNIVVNGLSEKKGENPTKVAVKFLKNISKDMSANDIENAHRLGNPGEVKRPLLIKQVQVNRDKENGHEE